MKMCDECGMNPATIHLTQIMQKETHVFNLCEECAKKKGISLSTGENQAEVKPEPVPDKICSKCGFKLSEFRKKGFLGCSGCYESFKAEIEELLIQVHGTSVHSGKRINEEGLPLGPIDIQQLRSELHKAIKNEQFEHAAMLRDAIHNLKQPGE